MFNTATHISLILFILHYNCVCRWWKDSRRNTRGGMWIWWKWSGTARRSFAQSLKEDYNRNQNEDHNGNQNENRNEDVIGEFEMENETAIHFQMKQNLLSKISKAFPTMKKNDRKGWKSPYQIGKVDIRKKVVDIRNKQCNSVHRMMFSEIKCTYLEIAVTYRFHQIISIFDPHFPFFQVMLHLPI